LREKYRIPIVSICDTVERSRSSENEIDSRALWLLASAQFLMPAQATPYSAQTTGSAQELKEKATDTFENIADKATDKLREVADQAEQIANVS
jgi:hypothetical protein